jgi:hypothetical protein
MDGTRQLAGKALSLGRRFRALGVLVMSLATLGVLAGSAFAAQPAFEGGPGFTVEKLQKIQGSGEAFTTSELTGKVGQTVEYEIVVTNEGETTRSFAPLEDANCTNVAPAGETEVAPFMSETFTCEHTLTIPGQIWSNGVTVESEESSEDSNTVFVRTIEEPEFTIEKRQRVQGTETSFTTSELTAKLGQTIAYEIVVSNTGRRALEFSPLHDNNCVNLTPAGETELAPGASETFTCQKTLEVPGAWTNVASIEAAFGQQQLPTIKPAIRPHAIAHLGGVIKKVSSNQVVVNVPADPTPPAETKPIVNPPAQVVQAQCTISESLIKLYGASGSKRTQFSVRVPALGIKKITFYLDGHKLKTLSSAQASGGRFKVEIDPGKLAFGAHRVSVKTVMTENACAAIARSAVFVHPRPPAAKPKFTG